MISMIYNTFMYRGFVFLSPSLELNSLTSHWSQGYLMDIWLLHVLCLCVVWELQKSEWFNITLITGISNSFVCWCIVSSEATCISVLFITHTTTKQTSTYRNQLLCVKCFFTKIWFFSFGSNISKSSFSNSIESTNFVGTDSMQSLFVYGCVLYFLLPDKPLQFCCTGFWNSTLGGKIPILLTMLLFWDFKPHKETFKDNTQQQ